MKDTRAHVQSKRPRPAAPGPYRHPFHPILVTIPSMRVADEQTQDTGFH